MPTELGMRDQNLFWGALAGAAGGLAGSFAMNLVSRAWSVAARGRLTKSEESLSSQGGRPDVEAAKKQQRDAGEPEAVATTATADRAVNTISGRALSPAGRKRAGELVHYGYGAAMGAVYGACAERLPAIRAQEGVAFGLLLWAASVPVALPLLRLSDRPTAYTAGEHAFSIVSHVVYGLVTEAGRRSLLASRNPRSPFVAALSGR